MPGSDCFPAIFRWVFAQHAKKQGVKFIVQPLEAW